MPQILIRTAALALTSALLLLGGCATSKDAVLPQDGKPMKEIYTEHFDKMGRQSVDKAREQFKGSAGDGDANLHGYVREAHNEIRAVFPRLPNPTLVMFVFPHLAGPAGVPIPGYTTSFPMYERVEYALPGEVSAR